MTAIDIIPITIGLFMGGFYAFSGFSDNGKVDDLAKNPRVKNFLWVIGGATAILLTDWKTFIGDGANLPSRAELLEYYLISAVGFAISMIAAVSVFIAIGTNRRAARDPVFHHQALDLTLVYLTYGFKAFQTQRRELEERGSHRTHALLAETGAAIAILMVSAAAMRSDRNAATMSDLINRVLRAVEDTVKLFAAPGARLRLETNYMELVKAGDLAGAKPMFLQAAQESYRHFLVTRRYENGASGHACLPVEPLEPALPGAPRCVQTYQAQILNIGKIDFKGVDKKVRDEINGFFKNVWYRSVLSVPIVLNSQVVGVVNVESDQVDLVGKGSDMVSAIGEALGPHCVILGELIAKTNGE